MLEVNDLKMSYGSREVLKGISFKIEEGKIVGFLGSNGAGKSTTMNLLAGYMTPVSGNVVVCDVDMGKDPKKAKSNIGYLPEIPPLYKEMKVIEYLRFVADLKKVEDSETEISRVISLFDIEDRMYDFIGALSKGYSQRVGFAATLMGDPKVLILDEPLVGLDPSESKKIRQIIKDLEKEHCILISSHILSEIDELCNEILILKDGLLVMDKSKTSVKRRNKKNQYRLNVKGDRKNIENALNNNSSVSSVSYVKESEPGVHEFLVQSNNSRDIRDNLFGYLVSKKYNVYGINRAENSLEDVFIEVNDREDQ